MTTLPSFASLVGVFVNAGADEILHTVSKLNLKGVQLSGDETCLLYTSDAADERSSVDLGGRRIIKKKKNNKHGAQTATK